MGCILNRQRQDGHQRVVRHGHLPEREVMAGIGPVAAQVAGLQYSANGARTRRPDDLISTLKA